MKALKRTLIILIIILLALISFGGIFVQKTKFVENILPDFKLGTDLTGTRHVSLAVSKATKDVYYDLDGNKVEEEGENTTKKEEPVNKEETLTKENYKKVREIIENRLNTIKKVQYTSSGTNEPKAIDYYIIKQDEETGKIYIQMPENSSTDMVLQYLAIKSDFTIVDEQENVLMDNSHIKEVKVIYNSTDSGVAVGLSIQFNKEGTEKLKEISNTFVKTTDEEGNETTKKITVKIDETEILNTYFAEEIANGIIQLSFGTASSNTTLTTYSQEANNLAMLLNTGNLPIVYSVEENKYILPYININTLLIISIIIISLIIISILVLIFKYTTSGILGAISHIGYIATLLITIRLTNVIITLEGMAGIIVSIILNYIFIVYLLNSIKNDKEATYKQSFTKYLTLLIPMAIITIVFCFVKWLPIYSFGMTMFWGIVLIALYNIILTKTLVLKK